MRGGLVGRGAGGGLVGEEAVGGGVADDGIWRCGCGGGHGEFFVARRGSRLACC